MSSPRQQPPPQQQQPTAVVPSSLEPDSAGETMDIVYEISRGASADAS